MSFKVSYRPDIDGLRAIAIILVIIFHAGFSFFSGGYIGVDVFFVLSGFLITSLIDYEIKEQIFSFKQFYLRRIRRIVPVLVFILLITTIPAYFLLFADNLESFGRTLIHTFLCTNNFYLYVNLSDYFAENSDLIPFLHTWSLSVEEQFYFFLPPFLLLLHKNLNISKRRVVMILLFVISLLFSIYQTKTNSRAAYFLLPSRLFELLIGSCVAIFWDRVPNLNQSKNNLLSIIGLLLILIPAITLNDTSSFPGINAFWPCLGTAMLIVSGKTTQTRGIINKLIENKFFVGVGLISYSIYLWHWPIFVFIKYEGLKLDGIIRIVALILIFVLSYFSWRFIEQPFRTTLKFNFKKTIVILFVPSLITISLIYGILDINNGFPERQPELKEFNPKTNFANVVRKECYYSHKIANCKDCSFGAKKDSIDGILIGDSFANHSVAFLDVLAKDANLYIHDCTAPDNPLLNRLEEDGTPIYPPKFANERLEYAKKFKYIFIAANWIMNSNPKSKNHQSIVNTIGSLVKLNKKIILIDCLLPINEMDLHKAKLIKTGKPIYFEERNIKVPNKILPKNYIVNEIKHKFPTVIIIDLKDVMCNSGKCDISINNTIIYKDASHLNIIGAKLLGEKYLKLKTNPLIKLNN
jgi:peptidoglycan/LPS O-acetylase OafA/YrhL